MRINDFSVSLSFDVGERSQPLLCRIRLVPGVGTEQMFAAREIVRLFGEACNLGMFAGKGIDPAATQLDIIEISGLVDMLEFKFALRNVPAASCRVLIGMLRGQILLDGWIASVEILSRANSAGLTRTFVDELDLPLPDLVDQLSFRYIRKESMHLTDRGIRITFAQPLENEIILYLVRVQAAWEAVGEGGCYSEGTQAVECNVLCEIGVVAASNAFEVKISVFSNPGLCFDYFANAVEKVSRTIRRVETMEVW